MLRGLVPVKDPVPASFANVARGLAKPVLIARVCKEVTISDENFDELLGLQEDGPVVQHIKKNDDKIVLSFKDKASRDKAKTLLSKGNILSKGEDGTDHEVFTSVFAPRKSYPAIVRFHDLDGVEIAKARI